MPRRPKRRTDQRSTTDVDSHIGRRLRDRRVLLGISLQALAETLGLAFQQVHKYECGTNRVSASRLYQLALALDVPITWFFDGIDDGRRRKRRAAELPRLTSDPGVLRFVRAYCCIKDAAARSRLRGMVGALAGER